MRRVSGLILVGVAVLGLLVGLGVALAGFVWSWMTFGLLGFFLWVFLGAGLVLGVALLITEPLWSAGMCLLRQREE
jgi:hypothetical protein